MDHESAHEPAKTLILLHGSRQTGDLLLGRLQKLQKRLWRDANVELIAPTASFPCEEDPNLRQWWRWTGPGSNHYEGFADETVPQLQKLWKSLPAPIGFIGFSQGGRLAHLAAILHQRKPSQYFPGLQCLIFVSGYDAPLPDGLEDWCPASQSSSSTLPTLISTPSLHVWGLEDGLITPQQSLALQKQYAPDSTQTFIHDGGHYVPMQAAAVRSMVDFVQATLKHASDGNYINKSIKSNNSNNDSHENDGHSMDEETKQLQIEEVQALEAIFPDKLQLPSDFYLEPDNEFNGSNQNVRFPIRYTLRIDSTEQGLWPKHPLYLHVTYPFDYPQARPKIDIKGDDNNVFEFSSAARNALSHAIHKIMDESESMPCVYACYVAAQEFFETGGMEMAAGDVADNPSATPLPDLETNEMRYNDQGIDGDIHPTHLPRAASPARIQQCQQEGLELSALVLSRLGASNKAVATSGLPNDVSGGGVWKFTIGLIGKPSAGKSTLFNAATAFARQRNAAANRANHASHASQDPTEHWLGGASMAPHPFTTIDPNVGVSVVPAPLGLCPEDDVDAADFVIGSTHGRDHEGRRLLPVVVKDVAGLVPGAYQGRGRGNQFLNDLTDADVLVHVVDASGSADKEGNALGVEGDGTLPESASHPLIDMQWILVELIEWVHTNLLYKWESILKKGRPKLAGMLSGYGYNRDSISAILNTVEDYMKKYEKRDRPMEDLSDWDDGDLHRLVTAFVGSRFPMVLALNKADLPTAAQNAADIQNCLPMHGAHRGTPLCAHQEMLIIKQHMQAGNGSNLPTTPISGVLSCLTSALSLREPVLVFPVTNFEDYASLPGLDQYATRDASLPNRGMLSYLKASGGQMPSNWDEATKQYVDTNGKSHKRTKVGLRDVLIMKPGSTVDCVFTALKNRGALDGEFVRAEAAGRLGEPSRPVPKYQLLDATNRILKIMTTKKVAWQRK